MNIYPTLVNTNNYEIDIGFNYFFVDCTNSNLDIFLPELLYNDTVINIKRIDSSNNTLTLNISTIDNLNIDNTLTTVDILPYDFLSIIAFDNKWWILNRV